MNRQEKYRIKHRQQGLCLDCSCEVESGVYCNKHAFIRSERRKKRYIKNKDQILEANRKRRVEYRKNNRCPSCSMPLLEEDILLGYIYCESCRCKGTVILKPK